MPGIYRIFPKMSISVRVPGIIPEDLHLSPAAQVAANLRDRTELHGIAPRPGWLDEMQRLTARMNSGVVPQQPPMKEAPASTNCGT